MDRQRGLIMNATSQVMVTLSADLLKQLRKEAREQHVPLRWLVTGWCATRWKRDGSCRMRDNPHSRGTENPSPTKPNRRARLSPLGVPADR